MADIADRIRKLLALASSSNPHEAASAAAEAQRLMVENDLSEACLEEGPPPVTEHEVEPDRGGRASLWRASLACAVGKVVGVKVVYVSGTTRIRSFGRGPDVAAHAALYHWLVAQLLPQCDRDWDWHGQQRQDRRQTSRQAFTSQWMLGAQQEVVRRMEESRRQVARQAPQGESAALVLLDRRAEETRVAIGRYLDAAGIRTTTSSRRMGYAPGAADMGRAAGARASLAPNSRTLAGRS